MKSLGGEDVRIVGIGNKLQFDAKFRTIPSNVDYSLLCLVTIVS